MGVFRAKPTCDGNGVRHKPLQSQRIDRRPLRSLCQGADNLPERQLQSRKGLCMLAPLAVPDRIDDVRLSRIDGVCPAAVIRNDGLNQPLLLTEGSPSRLSTSE